MTLNQRLFSELLDIIVELRTLYPTNNIILGGDFNIVPEEVIDRYPSKYATQQPNALISQLYAKLSLLDVWRHLNPYLKQYT